MNNNPIYFSGLNGLRAISALSVLFSHITLSLREVGLDPYIFGRLKDGRPQGLLLAGYSVTIFFVLSGFRITYLLLIEKEKRGNIQVLKFYARRILRIWPLYYSYLILALIASYVYKIDFSDSSVYCYIFFSANIPFILEASIPFLAHYWSIGVMEQLRKVVIGNGDTPIFVVDRSICPEEEIRRGGSRVRIRI
ncbi:MAG: acyltransferase [Bacteroidetes bacterium]|nr:acyltransferase [Bacteroidota bacterium]